MGSTSLTVQYWQLIWYVVILLLGVVGNTAVLFVQIRSKRIQRSSPFNVFLLSLSVTDLLISMVGLPTFILSTDTFEHPDGKVGDYLCKFVTANTLSFFFLDMSTFFMLVIYIERWKAIRKPFSVLDSKPLWKSVAIVTAVVLGNAALSAPTVYSVKYISEEASYGNHCKNTLSEKQSLVIYLLIFILDTVIPISIIVILCIHVAIYLRRTELEMKILNQNVHPTPTRSSLLGNKMKTIHTLTLVVLAFLMCVVPNHVIYLLSLAGVVHWNSTISQIGVLLRFSNSFVNPFLYSYSSQTFRNHCKEVFSCTSALRCVNCRRIERQSDNYKLLRGDVAVTN